VLNALRVYESGRSVRGSATWTPVQPIVDALNDAFYLAFDTAQPVGGRWMLSIDISASMGWSPCAGMPALTPRVAAAAMAMVTARLEEHHITVFSSQAAYKASSGPRWGQVGIAPAPVSPTERLDDVTRKINSLPAGGTDCALPMLYAIDRELDVDTFVIYTDSETYAGDIHPKQALDRYRDQSGRAAKLIVCGMEGNRFTLADPADDGMLDVVGFDTTAPEVMGQFAAGWGR
jgi:60 kDa SS-A/Ro ribonucleoprotein